MAGGGGRPRGTPLRGMGLEIRDRRELSRRTSLQSRGMGPRIREDNGRGMVRGVGEGAHKGRPYGGMAGVGG